MTLDSSFSSDCSSSGAGSGADLDEVEQHRQRVEAEQQRRSHFDRYVKESILTERTEPIMTRILVKDLIKARAELEPLIGTYLAKSDEMQQVLKTTYSTKMLIRRFNIGMGRMLDQDKSQHVSRTNERIKALAHMQAHETVYFMVSELIYNDLINLNSNACSVNLGVDPEMDMAVREVLAATSFAECVVKFQTNVVDSYEQMVRQLTTTGALETVCHAKDLLSAFAIHIPADFGLRRCNTEFFGVLSCFATRVADVYTTARHCDYLKALPQSPANQQSLELISRDPSSDSHVRKVCQDVLDQWKQE